VVFGFAVMSIKWNRFSLRASSAGLIIFAFVLLTLYQCLIIFGYENEEKFLPYSSIFLCFNVLFLALFLFFDNFNDYEDVMVLIKRHFKDGPVLDNKREVNFMEEVEA